MCQAVRIAAFLELLVAAGMILTGACATGTANADENTPQDSQRRPFFAFCFDTHDTQHRNLEQQATMLQQLGFDGAGHVGSDALAERLASLDRANLRLYLAGGTVDLSQDAEPQLAPIRQALTLLKGRETLFYVVLTGYPSMDPRGNEPGVSVLRKIADLAAENDIRVGLYPHTSDWVARADHAVDVVKRVERANCGVIFNLCHFLRNEELDSLRTVLQAAGPHLQAVMINGADPAGKTDDTWQRLIQPLDRGAFDLPGLLGQLDQLGYRGPIGLMCWGIEADSQEHLSRSMARWQDLNRRDPK